MSSSAPLFAIQYFAVKYPAAHPELTDPLSPNNYAFLNSGSSKYIEVVRDRNGFYLCLEQVVKILGVESTKGCRFKNKTFTVSRMKKDHALTQYVSPEDIDRCFLRVQSGDPAYLFMRELVQLLEERVKGPIDRSNRHFDPDYDLDEIKAPKPVIHRKMPQVKLEPEDDWSPPRRTSSNTMSTREQLRNIFPEDEETTVYTGKSAKRGVIVEQKRYELTPLSRSTRRPEPEEERLTEQMGSVSISNPTVPRRGIL